MSKFALKSSLLVALAAAGFMGCTTDTAGTVTDTGNTVAGVVQRSDGSEASGAVVRMACIRAEKGVGMPDMLEVTADTNGAFSFDSTIADTFQLAVVDTSVSEIFFMPRTTRGAKGLDSITLTKAVVLNSSLTYEDVKDPAVQVGSHFVVYVSGTPFYESVFAGDSFSILIPEGEWWVEFYPGDPQIVTKLQNSGVNDTLIYRSWSMESAKAGDTVNVGPFIWSTTVEPDSLIKDEEEKAKDVARLSGQVYCKNSKSCGEVEVTLVTDLFGFEFTEGDSLKFNTMTKTDSLGRWWLNVPKEVPEDSFRVEFRKVQEDVVSMSGTSRYVQKKEIEGLKDTLDLGSDTLTKTAGLVSLVTVVPADRGDSTQTDNCMVNSVVVGIKGTTHFIRDVTCETLVLRDLPAGAQEIVLYSGDPKVMSKMLESDAARESYVTLTWVSLPENAIQQLQGMTYTPPSQNNLKTSLASEP